MSAPPAIFKVGDIVRYNDGVTALMRISFISLNHAGPGDHRYYGQQCMGGTYGAYQQDCRAATPKDRATWSEHGKPKGKWQRTPWRTFKQTQGLGGIVGATED